MDRQIAATEEEDARAAANQLKAGNGAEFGQSLAKEYLEMGRNRHDFQQFMDIVARDNAADRKGNDQLPAVEFGTDGSGNYRVSITTPAWIWGNLWRDNNPVFSAVSSSSMYRGLVVGRNIVETAVAEPNSIVAASHDADVIAMKGSTVYVGGAGTHVTAKYGSTVHASYDSQTVAENGSNIVALQDARVTAQNGSFVVAGDKSTVLAGAGSVVAAENSANIGAAGGSVVIDLGSPHIAAQPGAKVLTFEQFRAMARH